MDSWLAKNRLYLRKYVWPHVTRGSKEIISSLSVATAKSAKFKDGGSLITTK